MDAVFNLTKGFLLRRRSVEGGRQVDSKPNNPSVGTSDCQAQGTASQTEQAVDFQISRGISTSGLGGKEEARKKHRTAAKSEFTSTPFCPAEVVTCHPGAWLSLQGR